MLGVVGNAATDRGFVIDTALGGAIILKIAEAADLGAGAPVAVPAELVMARAAWNGPSTEMRRFSAGMRVIMAMLCTLLLFGGAQAPGAAAAGLLLAYGLWAGNILWAEANGRPQVRSMLPYWVDVTWSATMLQITASAADMLLITLVQPVVLASIGYGVRNGLQLAVYAALAVLLDFGDPLIPALTTHRASALSALVVLALSIVAYGIDVQAGSPRAWTVIGSIAWSAWQKAQQKKVVAAALATPIPK